MLPLKLKNLIDENCMGTGTAPSNEQMDKIMNMASVLNADIVEVTDYMQKVMGGLTKEEQKAKQEAALLAEKEAKFRAEQEVRQKEISKFIDEITSASNNVLSSTSNDEFIKAKAKCETILKKAEILYGDDQRVQRLIQETRLGIEDTEKRIKGQQKKQAVGKAAQSVGNVGGKIVSKVFAFFGLLILLEFCIFIFPLYFPGYRAAIGNLWNKLVG